MAEASGEVLVFIDDDITVDDRWVRTYERVFEDAEIGAAGGPVETIFPEGSDPGYVRAVMEDGGSGTGHYMPDGGRIAIFQGKAPGHLRGGNMAIRAAAIEDVGDFDVAPGWGKHQIPTEETELSARICAKGYRVWYEPDAHVLHRFQIEKVNWAYLRYWHRGYGRASIIMKDRPSVLGRVIRARGSDAHLDAIQHGRRAGKTTLLRSPRRARSGRRGAHRPAPPPRLTPRRALARLSGQLLRVPFPGPTSRAHAWRVVEEASGPGNHTPRHTPRRSSQERNDVESTAVLQHLTRSDHGTQRSAPTPPSRRGLTPLDN